MLKITAEEIHFILYQYLHESGKSKNLIFNQFYPPTNSKRVLITQVGWGTWSFQICDLLIRSNWRGGQICYCQDCNDSIACRFWAFLFCFRAGGQHARKPLQRVSHSQWNVDCVPRKGPNSHPHGNSPRRCKLTTEFWDYRIHISPLRSHNLSLGPGISL